MTINKRKIAFSFSVLVGVILFALVIAWLVASIGKIGTSVLTPKPSPSSSVQSTTPSPVTQILPENNSENAFVKRVVDGDTIELTDGRRVRYIGINSPESVDERKAIQCFSKEASNKNSALVLNKKVQLEKDTSETDKYGRLLRYVYVDDVLVNEVLVREGYAHASAYPPDVKYRDLFRLAEREARTQNVGLWGSCVDVAK